MDYGLSKLRGRLFLSNAIIAGFLHPFSLPSLLCSFSALLISFLFVGLGPTFFGMLLLPFLLGHGRTVHSNQ